jgi:hypothetical protein
VRVLVTNHALAERAGTETHLLDVVRGLRALGDEVACYAGSLGAVAEELRAEGVPAVDDVARVPFAPDVIHGHHHVEAMTALVAFPDAPALYVCHGAKPWEEAPPRHPRILRYVAVCEATRERCVAEAGVPAEEVRVVPNFVDLDRFLPRAPLPARPRRALVLSNYASESTHLPAVRAACRRLGIELDARGTGVGAPCARPDQVLPGYDLVFAKGRAALEAAAVGCAVVLCDATGTGPLLSLEALPRLRALNFGFRTLTGPVDEAVVAAEVDRYDAGQAKAVSDQVRATAGSKAGVDALRAVHRDVVDRFEAAGRRVDPSAERAALAAYVKALGAIAKGLALRIPVPRRPRRSGWRRFWSGGT